MGVERVASNHQGVDFAGPVKDLDRFDGVPHGRVSAEQLCLGEQDRVTAMAKSEAVAGGQGK